MPEPGNEYTYPLALVRRYGRVAESFVAIGNSSVRCRPTAHTMKEIRPRYGRWPRPARRRSTVTAAHAHALRGSGLRDGTGWIPTPSTGRRGSSDLTDQEAPSWWPHELPHANEDTRTNDSDSVFVVPRDTAVVQMAAMNAPGRQQRLRVVGRCGASCGPRYRRAPTGAFPLLLTSMHASSNSG